MLAKETKDSGRTVFGGIPDLCKKAAHVIEFNRVILFITAGQKDTPFPNKSRPFFHLFLIKGVKVHTRYTAIEKNKYLPIQH